MLMLHIEHSDIARDVHIFLLASYKIQALQERLQLPMFSKSAL